MREMLPSNRGFAALGVEAGCVVGDAAGWLGDGATLAGAARAEEAAGSATGAAEQATATIVPPTATQRVSALRSTPRRRAMYEGPMTRP